MRIILPLAALSDAIASAAASSIPIQELLSQLVFLSGHSLHNNRLQLPGFLDTKWLIDLLLLYTLAAFAQINWFVYPTEMLGVYRHLISGLANGVPVKIDIGPLIVLGALLDLLCDAWLDEAHVLEVVGFLLVLALDPRQLFTLLHLAILGGDFPALLF